MIYLGADHRGFDLKEEIKEYLSSSGEAFEDLGDKEIDDSDDYPIYAEKVAKKVAEDSESKGILICGSGAGVDIVANKIDGIRCALVFDVPRAKQAREHENANIMALPSDALESNVALQMVDTFIHTPFSGEERHERRIEEIEKVEEEN